MTPKANTASLRIPRWILLIGGVAVIGLLIWWNGAGKIAPGLVNQRPSYLPNQAVVVVSEQTVPQIYNLVGTVESVTPVEAASRVSARVIAVPVHAGQLVHQGAVLVRLDPSGLKAQVAQATGELGMAQAELTRSQADYRRFAALVKRGSVTPHEFDAATAAYHAALGNVSRATAALAVARSALTYATVRAPVDAIVVERLVRTGDMALPGQPLVRLYDDKALRVEVAAPEELARQIRVGSPLKVVAGDGALELSTRVNEIVPAADPSTRSFSLRAPLPVDPDLKPGMFVRAQFVYGTQNMITLPRSAIRLIGQLATVNVLTPGAVQLRPVVLGREFNDRVEVLAGLKSGDRVIAGTAPMVGNGNR
ncbi:MAG TPA: efflux RND transporter periplasmic adaptor subunit [Candidatus Binataceae bacterium]|nr:efflux RND transporter periplasmic adaptor subunit [Candidatus Binataceae bacterium]